MKPRKILQVQEVKFDYIKNGVITKQCTTLNDGEIECSPSETYKFTYTNERINLKMNQNVSFMIGKIGGIVYAVNIFENFPHEKTDLNLYRPDPDFSPEGSGTVTDQPPPQNREIEFEGFKKYYILKNDSGIPEIEIMYHQCDLRSFDFIKWIFKDEENQNPGYYIDWVVGVWSLQ